jgi:hypothetical protein
MFKNGLIGVLAVIMLVTNAGGCFASSSDDEQALPRVELPNDQKKFFFRYSPIVNGKDTRIVQ